MQDNKDGKKEEGKSSGDKKKEAGTSEEEDKAFCENTELGGKV